jgi:hypothetical protein
VDVKAKADEKIQTDKAFIKDLGSLQDEKLQSLVDEKMAIEQQMARPRLNKKRKEELLTRLEHLNGMIVMLQDNQKYASSAEQEIENLTCVSQRAGEQIENFKKERAALTEKYAETEDRVPEEQRSKVEAERLKIRPELETRQVLKGEKIAFAKETEAFDLQHPCSELPQRMNSITMRIR